MNLLVLFWIAKRYYKLAISNNRSGIALAFRGIVIYTVANIGSVLFFYFGFPKFLHQIENTKSQIFDYFCSSIGIVFWNYGYLFYKRKFRKEQMKVNEDIVLIGK
ncbi:hypothetical protein EGI22_16600 [Lacihabitans sp. LS3-19]|nr:hypothetical protein [Lacihabitans sp. LS3-19]